MAKLTTKGRADLPKKEFAGPGRTFPIEDKSHARAALSGASHSFDAGHITASEEKRIDAQARRKLGK